MKIGIFGGSFNPPHNMHKKIALELIDKKYLDKVIYVPTGNCYQKQELIDAEDRYQMLKIMTRDYLNLSVSNYEIKNTLTYTYQTLDYFRNTFKDDEIYFICGSDNLDEITTWKNYQYILDKYKLIVIKRKSTRINPKLKNVLEADIMMSNLSSTKIRKLIKENKFEKLGGKLDLSVIEYIKKKNLYRK